MHTFNYKSNVAHEEDIAKRPVAELIQQHFLAKGCCIPLSMEDDLEEGLPAVV